MAYYSPIYLDGLNSSSYRCDICGMMVYPISNVQFCLICDKKLCYSHNHHDFCPDHWNDLLDDDKKEILRIDKDYNYLARYQIFSTIMSIFILIFSLGIILDDIQNRFMIGIPLLIISIILMIGITYLSIEMKSEKRQIKGFIAEKDQIFKKKVDLLKKRKIEHVGSPKVS